MNNRSIPLLLFLLLLAMQSYSQENEKKYSVTGTMGVSYEGYGLSRSPDGWTGYMPRKPWSQ
ncbi:MAG TPA: hypothetical protein VKH37_03460, partial [Ferruginibacter sp.]|nr:hypothetical protein [Ferruginibacter sp.]